MTVKNIFQTAVRFCFLVIFLLGYFFNFQTFGQDILSEKTLTELKQSETAAFREKISLLYDSVNQLHEISIRTAIAEQLFELTKNRDGLAHVNSLLFRKMNTLFSNEKGLFRQAYLLAEESGDFDAMCLVEYSRARYFLARKQYDSAMVYLLHYRDMNPEDIRGEGFRNIVNLMGDIYYHAGLYEQARDVYQSLYDQYVQENNWVFYRPYVMMNNLGQICLKTGNIEKAGSWFRLSLERAEKYLHTPYRINTIAYIRLKLAETALRTDDLKGAEAFLQDVAAYPADMIQDDVWLDYLWQQACFLYNNGNYQASLLKLDEILNIPTGAAAVQAFVPAIYQLLSDIYYAKADFEEALNFSRIYVEKTDSIRANEYLAQSMIILSDHNHTVTKMELQKTKTQSRYLFWGLLILTFLFLFLLWVLYNLHRSKLALVRKSIVQSIEDEADKKLEEASADTASETKSDNEDRDKKLFRELKYIMETKKPFLDPKLSILSLSEQLATNRTYLSQAINSQYHTTFPNYINEYRIQEAVRLITSGYTEGYTQEALATKVGFSSRGTFIAAFKKVTGVVPSFFIANHKKLEEQD